MELIVIAAMAANRVIGRNNTIPWRIREDMAHFKAATWGHTVIMGRKTYASIGHPLAGRRNIIISRDPGFKPPPDCLAAPSLDRALAACTDAAKVFVIGGAWLFDAALPLADTLVLTVIEQAYEGDTWFPAFEHLDLELAEERELVASPRVRVRTYRRRAGRGRCGQGHGP